MKDFILPFFGQIDLNELEEYYKTNFDYNGKMIGIDLNFKTKSIDLPIAEKIKSFIQDIDKFNTQNKESIRKDFESGDGETSDYISFYIEELSEDELSNIIDLNNKTISKELQIINKLILIRVGLYPEEKYGTESFGVFDYSILLNDGVSNQLLVVNTNENGLLKEISWES